MGGKILRCVSHPERLAVGICNDCGSNFCGECLHIYHLTTESVRVILYLDPTCLRRRHAQKADEIILAGVISIGFGVFASVFFPLIGVKLAGIFFMICGVGIIAYGKFRSKKAPVEITVSRALREKKRIEADSGISAEELYSVLLTQYVNRWGVQTGTQLLQSEIRAYTRRGASFSEAIKKIYTRACKI